MSTDPSLSRSLCASSTTSRPLLIPVWLCGSLANTNQSGKEVLPYASLLSWSWSDLTRAGTNAIKHFLRAGLVVWEELVIKRPWVRIQAPDNGWSFSHDLNCCIDCFRKTENKRKLNHFKLLFDVISPSVYKQFLCDHFNLCVILLIDLLGIILPLSILCKTQFLVVRYCCCFMLN